MEIVCLVTASWTSKIGLKILEDFISSDYSTDRNEVDDSKAILEDIGRQADLTVVQLDERDEGAPPPSAEQRAKK